MSQALQDIRDNFAALKKIDKEERKKKNEVKKTVAPRQSLA